jgi:hypothetical protein
MYDIGSRLVNVHTKVVWTVVKVDEVENYPDNLTVWTLANNSFEDMRVNAEYLRHYKPYPQEEE